MPLCPLCTDLATRETNSLCRFLFTSRALVNTVSHSLEASEVNQLMASSSLDKHALKTRLFIAAFRE